MNNIPTTNQIKIQKLIFYTKLLEVIIKHSYSIQNFTKFEFDTQCQEILTLCKVKMLLATSKITNHFWKKLFKIINCFTHINVELILFFPNYISHTIIYLFC